MYPYKIGASYNFTSLAPAILGADFKNAKLLSIMDYRTAIKFTNVDQQAAVVYPALPAGTPRNPNSYTYLLFETSANTEVVLADAWINETTIEATTSTTIVATISNATIADVGVIRNMLLQMGYTNLDIKTS